MGTNIIGLGVFPLLLLYAFSHRYNTGEFEKEFFSKRQTQTLKGILIIFVFFHHFVELNNCEGPIFGVYFFAQFTIALFFLISGYTTALGYSRLQGKPDLKKMWIKRSWRLYLPIVIFTLPTNNFLTAILFFFVLSDIAYSLFDSDKKRLAFIFAGNMIYPFTLKLLGFGDWWYDDILTFFMGVALFMYKEQITSFLKKKIYWVIMPVGTILTVISIYLAIMKLPFDYSTMIRSTTMTVIIVLFLQRLNLKSRLFYFVGEYTWEIFLTHQIIIRLMQRIFSKNILVLISSIVLTILSAVIVNKSVLKLKTIIEKRRMKN
ncbi:Acyltransferase family protein [Pseudobutyrivibrio sp. 49]|uniref:acyltransferase family protein n=1 Tax=Pseudobutyrivibrio sp. 49 TaxID=1855344 RepID=UPI00088FF2F9|nr:acyltransferase family protein [Pseudobutyrivibrio sp. 49]SDI03274.1 Acyltransferase family protein [Pseudobutyrivibrio sp. 49]